MTHQCKNSFMSAKTKWRRWVQKDARIAKKASLITEHNRANFFMVLRRRLVVALKTSKTNCTHWVLHQIRLTVCFASLSGRIKLELGRYWWYRNFCYDKTGNSSVPYLYNKSLAFFLIWSIEIACYLMDALSKLIEPDFLWCHINTLQRKLICFGSTDGFFSQRNEFALLSTFPLQWYITSNQVAFFVKLTEIGNKSEFNEIDLKE